MFKQILYLFLALITINVIILIHEFGHFLFAKIFKIKVKKFSIGFGKEIFGFYIKETRFSICSIFFGGYVKFFGENLFFQENQNSENLIENSETKTKTKTFQNNKNSFQDASFLQKFFTIFFGPAMNFIFAFFLLININFFIGTKYYDLDNLEVKKTAKNDIDIISGDKILEINNISVNSWPNLLDLIEKIKHQKIKDIPIKIERKTPDKTKIFEKTIFLNFEKNKKIGISPVSKFKKEKNILKSVILAYNQLKFLTKDFFIFRMLKSKNSEEKIKLSDFSSPIGILIGIKNSFTGEIYYFLMFLVILNINLVFFNLLPLIPLDGGYIILIFLQKVFTKNFKKANDFLFKISNLTIILIFLFTIFITIKDILFLFFRK